MKSDSRSRPDQDQLELDGSGPCRAYVSELRAGTVIDEVYLVSAKEFRTTRTGKPFLKLRVRDRTGDLDCMVWDNAEEFDSNIDVGDFALLNAKVSEYKGNVQLEAGSVQPGPVRAGPVTAGRLTRRPRPAPRPVAAPPSHGSTDLEDVGTPEAEAAAEEAAAEPAVAIPPKPVPGRAPGDRGRGRRRLRARPSRPPT